MSHSIMRLTNLLVVLCALTLITHAAHAADAEQPGDDVQFLGSAQPPQSPLTLWYRMPAKGWLEALPVGNGRVGGMVFGGVATERIQLNEDTLWAGPPVPEPNPAMKQALPAARKAWFEGDYKRCHELLQAAMPPRISPRSYQTLGDLHLRFEGLGGAVHNYRRGLDLDTAIASTTFEVDGVRYTREVLSTPVDQVLIVRLTASQPGKQSLTVKLDRPDAFEVTAPNDATLRMTGRAQHEGKHQGVRFQAELRAEIEGGVIIAEGDHLRIDRADTVTLYLAAATDYHPADPYQPEPAQLGQAARVLDDVSNRPYDTIRTDHIAAHRELFRRCSLELEGQTRQSLPTDERLSRVQAGETDIGLEALYFQFGRYLLISSSRPGCMPANLQGIWNEHLEAPWNADYHININMQMNYWPAEVTNLSECHEPFFAFHEHLLPGAQRGATELFGMNGAMAGHTTDAWKFGLVFGFLQYGTWPHGFGWSTQHFMEHYRYTGDKAFLRDRAYPILRAAATFYLDWLVEHPETGKLVSGPSTSPENTYLGPDGGRYTVSMGCAMDQQIIWDVFTNTLEAADALGEDDAFIERVRAARDNLAEARIGEDGRLMEWAIDFKEAEPGHRHISHLYAVHPGRQYNLRDSPDMLAAARKSIDYRLSHGGGHTGWSRAWIINFFARFEDGKRAHENLVALLQKSTHPNLFDNHPPFQIDGNFGGTAGIAEMLMQSHAGEIVLLPALPDAWPTGAVRGLCARGGFVLDVTWRDGQLAEATVTSKRGRSLNLRYGERVVRRDTKPGEVIIFEAALD